MPVKSLLTDFVVVHASAPTLKRNVNLLVHH